VLFYKVVYMPLLILVVVLILVLFVGCFDRMMALRQHRPAPTQMEVDHEENAAGSVDPAGGADGGRSGVARPADTSTTARRNADKGGSSHAGGGAVASDADHHERRRQ